MKSSPQKTLLLAAAIAMVAVTAYGQSSISSDLTNRCAWGANVGWINCRPTPVDGAVIGEFCCWGYLYAANLGWIRIGDGTPTNGFSYSNTSHFDYGVNHDGLGNLGGYAWGANVGWINFEAIGAPKVDLVTGDLGGYAWGANIGWISLSNMQGAVRTLWLDNGPDDDGDGIPDMWEYFWVGDTNTMTATSHSDADGVSDKDEYPAGTSPLNPNSYLRILDLQRTATPTNMDVTWTAQGQRHYYLEYASSMTNGAPWTDSVWGRIIPSGAIMTRPLPTEDDADRYWRVRAIRPLAE